jgi:aminoglycoside phosphotransferase family enzyme
MLKSLLKAGKVKEDIMEAGGGKNPPAFITGAQTGGHIDEMGGLETIRHNHEENFAQTKKYIDKTIPFYQMNLSATT